MVAVLIVDDRKENLALLQAVLKRYDLRIISANDGQSAYSLAQTEQPNLILLDLLMPEAGWDGYTTMEALQADAGTSAIPVIAITAAGDIGRARSMNFVAVLHRPFPLGKLEALIMQYLPV